MTTEFHTRNYEFTHGRKPRGFGSWAFTFEDDETVWWAPAPRTFAEAKKAAVAEARKRSARHVTVCT